MSGGWKSPLGNCPEPPSPPPKPGNPLSESGSKPGNPLSESGSNPGNPFSPIEPGSNPENPPLSPGPNDLGMLFPPPWPMEPISERVRSDASISEDESSCCPASVEGIVPSSCPWTLSILFPQKPFMVSTAFSNSSCDSSLVKKAHISAYP